LSWLVLVFKPERSHQDSGYLLGLFAVKILSLLINY